MEKLAYLLWKEPGFSANGFRDRLLAKLPHRLPIEGAVGLKISVTDDDVAAGTGLHMGPRHPDAFVSFWLECSQDRRGADEALAMVVDRFAGYLVVESRPLRREPEQSGAGLRSSGFSLVGCIPRAGHISHEEFIAHWYGVHRDVAIATQSSFAYVRNEVVRPLTIDAPPWHALVEEGFPTAALDDPMVFYDADGSEARYRRNLDRMIESCKVFIDMQNVDSHPMSEYCFD
ncbi:MAG: EthD domain-containing protein [Deltaproteobacteria bacterium]|jgi:hypothetical protein|nr:EthD domain-containing protein [Deltaproteobacteria bacterium]